MPLCGRYCSSVSPLSVIPAKSAQALYQEAVNAEKQLEKSKKLQADKNIWYKVARRYHKVVLSHPQSGYCDDALWFEGELYRRADEKFREREAVVRALDAYHLLVKGYPSSKWCRKAHLRRADLYSESPVGQEIGPNRAAGGPAPLAENIRGR